MQRVSIILKNSLLLISMLLGNAISHAQVSNTLPWTWMKGDNGSNNNGVYGTMGVAASTNKPGAREPGGVEWTDAVGNLWLFGGYGYPASGGNGMMNDLWKYDLLTNNWTWVNGDNTINTGGIYGTKGIAAGSNKPGARYLGAAWSDNSGSLWLFGGYGYDKNTAFGSLNDLWKYNIATNLWTWVSGDNTSNNTGVFGTKGVSSPTNKPGGRNRLNEMIGKVDAAGYLWMFGGAGYAITSTYGALNDLWKYNIAINEWTWVSGDNTINNMGVYGTMGTPSGGNKPGARDGGVCWVDTAGKFWLFGGGYDASGGWTNKLSDLWKYDAAIDQWTWMKGDNIFDQYGIYNSMGVANTSSKPGGRLMNSCWLDNYGNFWTFGGYGWAATGTGSTGNQGLNDLWKYDPLTNNWTWMKGDNTPNSASVYGTQGIAAATNKPGNRSGGNHWIDGYGNLWQMGGIEWYPSGVHKNDLWKLLIPQPVAKGNLVSCQTLPTVTIDVTNNNTWVPVFDNVGNIAAEINANTNNLGIINTSLFTKTGTCREDTRRRLYLNRNITITPQTQPITNVSVRLYILKAELDSLKTALNSMGQPSGVASINEVDVFKNEDVCVTVGIDSAFKLTAATGTYNSDYYLQVSISSFSSFYFANKLLSVILPVKIKNFMGKRSGQTAVLKWEASCNATVNFNIERSTDGIHFETIGNVIADVADCNKPFSFTDDKLSLNENYYYRLLINEPGVTENFSSIILLPGDKGIDIEIKIIPELISSSILNMQIIAEDAEQIKLFITDVTGRIILTRFINVQSGINYTSINLPSSAVGIYYLSGIGKSGKTNVARFVKK